MAIKRNFYGLTVLSERRITTTLGLPTTSTSRWIRRLKANPLQWTLERLGTRLPAMLIRAGAGELARTLDQRDIDAALPTVRGWAESLQTQERQKR